MYDITCVIISDMFRLCYERRSECSPQLEFDTRELLQVTSEACAQGGEVPSACMVSFLW